MIKNIAADNEAKMYVYDLYNCARENGFKADDKWEVSLATDEEKTAIINKYIPTLSVKVAPALISEVFSLVKEKLNQQKTEAEMTLNANSIRVNHLHHMIAFSAKKLRR